MQLYTCGLNLQKVVKISSRDQLLLNKRFADNEFSLVVTFSKKKKKKEFHEICVPYYTYHAELGFMHEMFIMLVFTKGIAKLYRGNLMLQLYFYFRISGKFECGLCFHTVTCLGTSPSLYWKSLLITWYLVKRKEKQIRIPEWFE